VEAEPDEAAVQKELEDMICVPLQSPLIRSRPRLRRSRTPISVGSLRRSGRLAAKPRAANATRQAQIVLLKKLGVHVDTSAPDLEIEQKFKATFRGGNMSANKQQALQILFNSDFDPMAMGLDMAELDAVET